MSPLKPNAHIHLMGICGTAMASLAGILKEMDYQITGSDENVYPPMSTQLEKLGIEIMQGYRKENLNPKPDLVIVGNVITRNHEEAQALLASDIPYTSLPKAMGEFVIAHRNSVVVSGTHGKTTTTSMMAWVADQCGLNPGFLIGGIPENYQKSFKPPQGEWFVIEGDEYDTAFFDKVPKFVHYKPKYVVLTSIEFDHADIYKDLEDVKAAFKKLITLIPSDGLLVTHAEDENIKSILPLAQCRVVTYGLNSGDYQAVDREQIAGRNQFSIRHKDQNIADIAIKQFGPHNTLNALATFAMARELGWDNVKTLQALADFKGVKRRQEIIGEPRGITIIEDFAHHPTAVELTIQSVKEKYSGRKVFAVFEPRSATSRRAVFQKDYVRALSHADVAIVAQPYNQSKISETERFSVDQLITDLKQKGSNAQTYNSTDEIVAALEQQTHTGDVILVMSNGGFDGIYQKLLKALEPKHF